MAFDKAYPESKKIFKGILNNKTLDSGNGKRNFNS